MVVTLTPIVVMVVVKQPPRKHPDRSPYHGQTPEPSETL